jgi:hypothetical protein
MQTEYIAKAIIAQIESTHPDDAAGLDQIDQKVAQFLGVAPASFTRSRDALKAIRPPKFWLKIQNWPHGRTQVFGCFILESGEVVGFLSGCGTTEELAELHVIIQGVAYTRGYHFHKYELTTPWILDEDENG